MDMRVSVSIEAGSGELSGKLYVERSVPRLTPDNRPVEVVMADFDAFCAFLREQVEAFLN